VSIEQAEDKELTSAEAQQLGVQIHHSGGPRRVRLTNPRRWRKFVATHATPFLECPYCLCLVRDKETADQHLWRRHAGNNRERAGEWDWEPWASDLELRLSRLERDLVHLDSNGLERTYEDEDEPKRRRLINRIWCRYPAPPREGWQQ
jgi:hypothetical protein